MKDFFNFDGFFFRTLDKLGSLFILNMLTIVCSIPLVTAGAAFTALYYVTMKMVRDEETYVTKDYFRSFRQNFRQGTVIWLIHFIIVSFLIFDYRLITVNRENMPYARIFMILVLSCSLLLAVEMAYVFPVLAKFYNTVSQTMKNAFLMGIRHFPKTVGVLFIDVIFFVITAIGLYRNGKSLLAPLYICLGFSVPAFANSYIFLKIFDNYIPSDQDTESGSDTDEAEILEGSKELGL